MNDQDARKRILAQMLHAQSGNLPWFTDTEVENMRAEGLVETDDREGMITRAPVRLTQKGVAHAKQAAS